MEDELGQGNEVGGKGEKLSYRQVVAFEKANISSRLLGKLYDVTENSGSLERRGG